MITLLLSEVSEYINSLSIAIYELKSLQPKAFIDVLDFSCCHYSEVATEYLSTSIIDKLVLF